MRVMVVDDDPMLVEQTSRYLARRKHEVTTALSGEAALARLEEQATEPDRLPQVIFTDIRMGLMNGLDLLSRVRERWPHIHLIVITGYGTIEMAVEAMRRGAFDFITKPFRTTLLAEKIAQVEDEMELRRRLQTPEEGSAVRFDRLTWLAEQARERPVLLVAPEPVELPPDPEGTCRAEQVRLSPTAEEGAISPGHLHTLLRKLEAFREEHMGCLIYFEGLDELLRFHPFETLLGFFSRFMGTQGQHQCHLCLAVHRDELTPEQFVQLQQLLTQDQLINLNRSLAHEARLAILFHLGSRKRLAFNELYKKLDLASSASLTFHLKQLRGANLVEQDQEGLYRLSEEGTLASEILTRLQETSASNTSGPSTLLTLDEGPS